ncbi:hypothetical protein ABBQ32_14211 [Trebouxia sp. C0010 RCD-2024]
MLPQSGDVTCISYAGSGSLTYVGIMRSVRRQHGLVTFMSCSGSESRNPPVHRMKKLAKLQFKLKTSTSFNGSETSNPPAHGITGHLHQSCSPRQNTTKMLQWLREQDPPCPWGVETCAAAAQRDDLIVLQWLRAQKPACPWDATTCTSAAKHDPIVGWRSQPNPHVLARALLHGCPAADLRHEKLRSQLVFLACIKRQEKKRICTRACKLGVLFF